MAIYTNLPVYKASYSLLLEINRMMPNLPRDCRYSLGQELRHRIMEIIVLIYRANRTKEKVSLISKMRETLLEVQVYIRLFSDLKYISERKYVALIEETVSMSKQMSAWEKSEQNKVTNEK
ncbi:MAG: four helix bundle protein [Lentimicrobiaceae bacterium]|nr:four helix bundle protein [Lentimicrobiaceae bacterium]